MPKVGQKRKYNNKEGVVTSIDILNRKYIITVDEERFEVSLDE